MYIHRSNYLLNGQGNFEATTYFSLKFEPSNMKIILRIFFIVLSPLLGLAQQVTFEDYRIKADRCLEEKNYSCAIQNYERALRIRENDNHCTDGLKKAKQLQKAVAQTPIPPKSTAKTSSVSPKTTASAAYLLGQTDLPVNIVINGGSSVSIYPKDLVKKIPLNVGDNTVQVKPIDGGPGGFERTMSVSKSENKILIITILAQRNAHQERQKLPSKMPEEAPNIPKKEEVTPQKIEIKKPEDALSEAINSSMILVTGGTFQMGGNHQKPIHTVTLRDFYIGKYEVTQQQWRAVIGKNPAKLNDDNCNDCPITQVSWEDVQEFLQKLNKRTDLKYRLPTEAEWEYAARGGQKSNHYTYAGDNSVETAGWYQKNSQRKTHPVGQKKANELGLYDMTGNVWEWCHDWFNKNYYAFSPVNMPVNATPETYRVIRGGAADTNANSTETTHRDAYKPVNKSAFIGFRLVRD